MLKPKTCLNITARACLLLIAVPAAWALDWRLEAQWEASRQDTVSAPLALIDASPFTWTQRYDLSLADAGAGLDVRFEPENDGTTGPEWTVRQAYYDAGPGDYEVTLGQKHLHWDYGFLANPLNWVGPADGRSEFLAEPLLSVQQFRGINTDQAVCTLRLEDRQELCLVRTQGFYGALDWQLAAGYEEGWQLGAGASWVPGQRWEYHGSLTWYETALQRTYRDGRLIIEHESAWNILVGASTSGQGGWQLLLEHHLDTRALSADDWSDVQQDLKAGAVGALAPAWQSRPLTAHRSLVRLTQNWNDWDLTGALVGFWSGEPTVLTELELTYAWTQSADLTLGWQTTPASGMLGQIGQGDIYTVGINWVLAP
ncbi:MAG: hypothetical protein ABJ000_20615 [Saccharospirillum sp.]|uniref:hypothetical protein n=1 Tax=Saccharospirillum sp. TaxID=2033801 RepID=UPI003297A6C8